MSNAHKLAKPVPLRRAPADPAREEWEREYRVRMGEDDERRNRSGIAVKPLYGPDDWDGDRYARDLGFPGQPPYTRGIYPSMHRGRPWSQRQLIGLATPAAFNARQRQLIAAGATAVSLIPCNSVFRGYDIDEVEPVLLGTCGTTVNTVEDIAACFEGIPLGGISVGLLLSQLRIPPPTEVASLVVNVQPDTVGLLLFRLRIPPPSFVASLLTKMQSVTAGLLAS